MDVCSASNAVTASIVVALVRLLSRLTCLVWFKQTDAFCLEGLKAETLFEIKKDQPQDFITLAKLYDNS